jgi:hypothetical protein
MTMQISDQLIYNNEVYNLDDEILEPFLQEKGIRSKHAGGFSANWRGYVAEFEIKNFEIHLNSKNDEFFENIIRELGSTKIHYLNKLIILYSNVIGEYSNWSISLSEYETYQILEFKEGNLIDFKILSNSEFKKFKNDQFLKYIETEDYEIEKQNRIRKIDYENEILRIEKNKGLNWHKFKFKETEFLEEIEKHILNYTKKFY